MKKPAREARHDRPESSLWATVTYPQLEPGIVYGTKPGDVRFLVSPGFGWLVGSCQHTRLQDQAEFVDQACATPTARNAYWFRGHDGQVVAASRIIGTSFQRVLVPGLQITHIADPPATSQLRGFDQAIVEYARSHTICVRQTDEAGTRPLFDGRLDHQGSGCSDLSTLERVVVFR